ncbi:hypothetical protein Barb7_02294 [Bacteroidales bacterium Barb7]|nr:hypothetical protein Barb7_02294 [Bacteroidales bacterium Barb7]
MTPKTIMRIIIITTSAIEIPAITAVVEASASAATITSWATHMALYSAVYSALAPHCNAAPA